MRGRCLAAALALAGLTILAHAAEESLANITIEARRQSTQQRADRFVRQVIVRRGLDAYPVWRDPICLHVSGVPAAQQEYLRARLTQIITAAGAPMAAPGCEANFHLIASAHATELVKAWTQRADHAGAAPPGWHLQARRLLAPRPVRVWYGVEVRNADGTELTAGCPGQGGGSDVRVSCNAFASRLTFNDLSRFGALVIIVDLAQVEDFSLAQLADYIGFVGLTRVDPDAELHGEATVLGLFRVPREDRPQGLTPWDEALLGALYHTNLAVQNADADIARRMAATLVH